MRTATPWPNVDSVDVTVKGVGGHGAYPQLAKDPIVLAARIVTALQTLVAREVDPLESGVVTVGSFIGGTKHNIIPEEAKLQLTVRSYTPEVRKLLLDGIARIATGRGDRRGHAGRSDAGDDPAHRVHAGDAQHPAAHQSAWPAVQGPLRRGPREAVARADGRRGLQPLQP
jgi:metal-dependent amidase/aminoacylase/carboxypeptidase family protein